MQTFINARILPFIFVVIMISCLASKSAYAVNVAPEYTYESRLTIAPEPDTHLELFKAEMQQAYERCAGPVLAKGYGTCPKFEPYRADDSQSSTVNGYPYYYVLLNKYMTVTPLPMGGYSINQVHGDANSMRIDLQITCPAGSVKSSSNPAIMKCECKADGCLKPALNGPATPKTCTAKPQEGNPINIANGNKFQKEIDYLPAAHYGLEMRRGYNSSTGNWTHSYSDRLEISNRDITLITSDGRASYFLDDGVSLIKSTVETGALARTELGFTYVSEDNRTLYFDNSGKLISLESIGRPGVQISHIAGQILLSDTAGNAATLTEDPLHQPLSFSTSGFTASYSYNSAGQLESVTKLYNGKTAQRSYHYEDSRDPRLLTGITDEKGVRFATWKYDDQGRAISSEHANGAEKITVEYRSDSSTYVTNEFGKLTEYQFARFDGAKRLMAVRGMPSANCHFSNSSFTYNSFGQLLVSTNNRGNRTTYLYNDRGLERSRTEAAGTPQARTITTEWHPTLFLPLVVTEPNRITTYQYDTQGRQLSRTVEAR
ncbi:DUF6531 domain-containing protein [Pseudomonas paralcaligenes]|uniref:DUF6531 domain-containing protein n=1 Tax=Pseudomonas paralcaligenes TaxID=2772558 RepID=UPI001C7FDC2A|nr:DUF6531 domain-containing protein [Pseudomonas paralcaligenes]